MAAGVAQSHNIWEMGQILPDNRLVSRPRRVTRTINSGMHAAARTCKTTEHGSLWGFAKRELAEMCRNGTVRAPSQQIITFLEARKGHHPTADVSVEGVEGFGGFEGVTTLQPYLGHCTRKKVIPKATGPQSVQNMRVGWDPGGIKCQARTSLIQRYDSSGLHYRMQATPQPSRIIFDLPSSGVRTKFTRIRVEQLTGELKMMSGPEESQLGMNSAAVVLISMITSPQRGCGLLGPSSEKYGVQASRSVGSSERS